jgi:prepilin-type N-terminal cleavage/methylation domain-containing protein
MKRARTISRGALTLVEMLVALVVISIVSVAVFTMVAGAADTSLYVTSGTDTVSQVETAYRRMLHNARACSAITAPTGTSAATTLTLKTQNDPSNGNAPRTVTYALSNGNLVETDVGASTVTSTLVTGVTNFAVTRITTTSPQQVQISVTAGRSPAVTRTVTIYCRNL